MRGHLNTKDFPLETVERMCGPTPHISFDSDGCTCVPDEYFGCDLRPACHWHDYAYHLGGDESDRLRADRCFFHNLWTCGSGLILACMYFYGVRVAMRGFNWRQRPSKWRRVYLVFSALVGR